MIKTIIPHDKEMSVPGRLYLFVPNYLDLLSWLSGLPWFSWLTRLSLLTTSASGTASTAALVPALAPVAVAFALTVLVVAGQIGDCQSLGEVDLSADRVGQVADHEDILDMVVEVVFDLRSVDLGHERQGAHEVLAQGGVGLLLLVQDAVDPFADAVQQAERLLD